jgi:hypothetical protein
MDGSLSWPFHCTQHGTLRCRKREPSTPSMARAASLSRTSRTARSRTSGETLFLVLLMMLHPTQKLEPPANPARFTPAASPSSSSPHEDREWQAASASTELLKGTHTAYQIMPEPGGSSEVPSLYIPKWMEQSPRHDRDNRRNSVSLATQGCDSSASIQDGFLFA